MDLLMHLLDEYGYIVLFFSLMLELIIVPIPNEILMSYVGFLVYQGKLNLFLTILFGGVGGIIGVSISYWIGFKLGKPFFNQFGSKFHMGPEKLEKMAKWNKKYGRGLLLVSFFIPGVRHLTSIFSGVTRISFKSFASFAYIGVFLWVGTFIYLGNIFGPQWEQFHQQAKIYAILACIALGVAYLIYFLIKTNKDKIKDMLILLFEHTFIKFRSFLKIKLLIFLIGIVFIGLMSLMVGMIQDFIANEFGEFNTITTTIIQYTFHENWKHVMMDFNQLCSYKSLSIFICLTLIWILFKVKNRLVDIQFYIICLLGAFLFSKGLHVLFSKITTGKAVSSSFPSEQTLISFVILIFFMYEIIRHSKNHFTNIIIVLLSIFTLASIAVSRVYLGLQLPSDLVAGYAFGGVWVSFIILLVEISKLLNLFRQSTKRPVKLQ